MFMRTRIRRRGQRVAVRPQVDLLEGRLCPSCTVAYDPSLGLLSIQGDETGNKVSLVATSDGIQETVAVTCEGKPLFGPTSVPLSLKGVEINTLGGNDRIEISIRGQDPDHPFVVTGPLDLSVNAGGGKDTFTLDVQNVVIAKNAQVTVRADGGEGDNTLSATVDGLTLAGTFTAYAASGAGKDTVRLGFTNTVVTPTGSFSLTGNTGGGADTGTVDIGTPNKPGVTIQRNGVQGGRVVIDVNLGDGDDTLTVNVWQADLDGTVVLLLDGGPGTKDKLNVFVKGKVGTDVIYRPSLVWVEDLQGFETIHEVIKL